MPVSHRRVEEQCPVDRTLTRYRAKSQQVRKERHGISLQVQSVAVANLGVTVAISCVGKLERDKSALVQGETSAGLLEAPDPQVPVQRAWAETR